MDTRRLIGSSELVTLPFVAVTVGVVIIHVKEYVIERRVPGDLFAVEPRVITMPKTLLLVVLAWIPLLFEPVDTTAKCYHPSGCIGIPRRSCYRPRPAVSTLLDNDEVCDRTTRQR